uniref:AAA+ ATPase domain-containing protein n=1 Tax=Ciona savignyi TaxID=51511 RepID=H2Y581_CIOSA
ERWPSASFGLDKSQLHALQTALTNEVALIQGPPGTGKTYIGLKVMRLLLANQEPRIFDPKNPILVVCYTNHALDQFLEGILKFNRSGIIRVGGRCKSKKLEQYTLKNRREKNSMFQRVKDDIEDAKRSLIKPSKMLHASNQCIVSLVQLERVILPRLFQQFSFNALTRKLDELRNEVDLSTLDRADVIGMTTTGAARCRNILNKLPIKVVVVEEAAEVLEAHIITSMPKSTEHLILIGDHQQLKPSPNVHELATKMNLEISLFERLVRNNLPYAKLTCQHRMKPRIADLLRPHIYETLTDNKNVKEYEDIRGVDKSVFFISHQHKEDMIVNGKTKRNQHEAEFIVALCKYLLLQEYKPSQITILTTYTGQLLALKNIINKRAVELEDVYVTVVDNYQGEENDIILLSLVRSNESGSIGFLEVHNRVCVALSRAKKGLFCIGNMKLLQKESNVWYTIVKSLEEDQLIGNGLALKCGN